MIVMILTSSPLLNLLKRFHSALTKFPSGLKIQVSDQGQTLWLTHLIVREVTIVGFKVRQFNISVFTWLCWCFSIVTAGFLF